MPKEELKIYVDSPSVKCRPWVWLCAAILVLTGLTCMVLVHRAAVVMSALGAMLAGGLLLWIANTEYVVTNTRVIRRGGILRSKGTEALLRDIRGLEIHQTPMQRLLGIGDLEIVLEIGSIVFAEIDEPEKLRAKLESLR